MNLKDVLLVKKFGLLNKGKLKIKINIYDNIFTGGFNFWMWSNVQLEELSIPDGLVAKAKLYGPDGTEYSITNKNDIKIGILDTPPIKRNSLK